MKYKYKKGKLLKKQLNVPTGILDKIHNNSLSFPEYIEYGLDNKIPISCLKNDDQEVIERFGLEKTKNLDWELITSDNNIRQSLMNIDPKTEDINTALYELVIDQVRPSNYSSKMKEIYSDRVFNGDHLTFLTNGQF